MEPVGKFNLTIRPRYLTSVSSANIMTMYRHCQSSRRCSISPGVLFPQAKAEMPANFSFTWLVPSAANNREAALFLHGDYKAAIRYRSPRGSRTKKTQRTQNPNEIHERVHGFSEINQAGAP
jgi:hypothetical protein